MTGVDGVDGAKSKKRFQPYPPATLSAVASILGDTHFGLSNSEIEKLLRTCRIKDPRRDAEQADPMVRAGLAYISLSKRERIEQALIRNQSKTGTGNALLGFIIAAMEPQRYIDHQGLFRDRQQRLNEALSFVGLRIDDKGQVASAKRAATLTEAAQLAGRLHSELVRRGHTCKCAPLLLRGNSGQEHVPLRTGGREGHR